MTEFSDTPFYAGSLFGLRAFVVDGWGRLQGPEYGTVFTPGENTAQCLKGTSGLPRSPFSSAWYPVAQPPTSLSPPNLPPPNLPPGATMTYDARTDSYIVTMDPPGSLSASAIAAKPPEHKLAGMGCRCGYYAYYDGGNDWYEADKMRRVAAIIEGYGRCVTGTRGFRAEKARLVALVVKPKQRETSPHSLIFRNYPDVPMYNKTSEALANHDISPPNIPSPDTVEDFWTRKL